MRISDWSSDVCSSDLAGVNYLALDIFRPTPPSPTTEFIVNNFLGGVWPVGSLSDTLYGDKSEALFANISYELDRSEERMSELQSLMRISYAVFCLKKKKNQTI